MAKLVDLVVAERAAGNEVEDIYQAARGRSMTDDEQRRFDAAAAKRDDLNAQIDTFLPGAPRTARADATGGGGEAEEQQVETVRLKPRPDPTTPAIGQASMRQQLRASGMIPRDDPGAGLSPMQANMARQLARGAH